MSGVRLCDVSLERLIPALSRARTLSDALESARGSADFSVVEGLRVPLLAAVLDARPGPQCLLAIVATGREADAVMESLASVAPHATVLDLPAWETLPHERLSPSAETVGRRIRTLRALRAWADAPDVDASGTPKPDLVVVASVRAALQPLVEGLTDVEPVVLERGGRGYDLAQVTTRLIELAYTRVDMVTRRGEFAVRGGILDVFPPTEEHPLRIELWGDTVEEVRSFSVADQRSLELVPDGLWAPAVRELLLTPQVRERAAALAVAQPHLAECATRSRRASPSRAWSPWPPSSPVG